VITGQSSSVLHGVGETGIPFRAIAEVIGTRLRLPVREIAASRASEHFGWIGSLAGADAPAASELTRELLNWEPSHAGLLDDLNHGDFFPAARP
jgi:hypothetical protein